MKKAMKKGKKLAAVILAASLAAGALGVSALAEGETKSMLFFTAFIGDFGLSDMGYQTARDICDEYGWDLTLVEYGSYDPALAVNSFYDAIETNHYDYFLGPDWYIADILNEAVKEYPDTTFVLYDTGRTSEYVGDNVYGISFACNESSFLAAIIQAEMTRTGMIGCLSADSPILNDFSTGWLYGARYAQEELGLDFDFVHTYMVDQTMSGLYEQMNVLYDNGCDAVWPISAQFMLGSAQAAEEHGGYEEGYFVMGCDYDQYTYFKELADEGSESAVGYENIATSITKNITNCVELIVDAVENGTASAQTGNQLYGVAQGGVGVLENEHYQELIPEDVREIVSGLEEKIADGEIVVPSYFDFDSYDDFASYRDNG